MPLTQLEFLTVVDQLFPDIINIWYSDTDPLTVYGITIPVLDNTDTDVTQLLQAIQEINITINGYNYTFEIESRSQRTALGFTYYFFDIIDQEINTLADDTSLLIDQIIFVIPGLQDINFLGGDYDVLINNVDLNRTSTNIMISDRYKILGGIGSVNPLNIDAIRNLTAEKAEVQDSNYSITGWTNGRYNGTPTDRVTYGGVDAAITGKFFEGALFPLNTPTVALQQQISSSQITYEQYLNTGDEDIPTVPDLVSTDLVTVNTIGINDTQILTNYYSPQYTGIEIGDIINILNASPPLSVEYMRVTNKQVTPNTPGGFFTLTVDRGWNNTTKSSHAIGPLPISKLGTKGPVKIYKSQGNKIQGVEAGKFIVRDSQEILTLDTLGQILAPLP